MSDPTGTKCGKMICGMLESLICCNNCKLNSKQWVKLLRGNSGNESVLRFRGMLLCKSFLNNSNTCLEKEKLCQEEISWRPRLLSVLLLLKTFLLVNVFHECSKKWCCSNTTWYCFWSQPRNTSTASVMLPKQPDLEIVPCLMLCENSTSSWIMPSRL